MQEAQTMAEQYQRQIIDLSNQMSALELNIDTNQASQAVLEIKSLIDSIPAVTTKTIVSKLKASRRAASLAAWQASTESLRSSLVV